MANRRAARLLFQLPRESRTYAALKPELQWGLTEIWTNKMVYLLEMLVWQKTKDAQKKMPLQKPRLFVPDFMQGLIKDPNNNVIEGETHSTDEVRDILNMRRE